MLVRIITGIVGIGLAAFVIQSGGLLFAACGLVLALGAWFEYCNAFSRKGYSPAFLIGGLFVSAMCYAAYGGLYLPESWLQGDYSGNGGAYPAAYGEGDCPAAGYEAKKDGGCA